MSTEAVINASAIVALYVPEETSNWIRMKVEEYTQFHILDLTMYEVDNAIWRKGVLLKELNHSEMELVFANIQAFIDSLCISHPYSEIRSETIRIATKHGLTIYNSAYISLAQSIKSKFITTDATLIQKLRNTELEEMLETPYHGDTSGVK
ncbi:MAG: type II toxin-antitoxin system VapC family toxin [Candidatus Bathyarchaeia archaeon]